MLSNRLSSVRSLVNERFMFKPSITFKFSHYQRFIYYKFISLHGEPKPTEVMGSGRPPFRPPTEFLTGKQPLRPSFLFNLIGALFSIKQLDLKFFDILIRSSITKDFKIDTSIFLYIRY